MKASLTQTLILIALWLLIVADFYYLKWLPADAHPIVVVLLFIGYLLVKATLGFRKDEAELKRVRAQYGHTSDPQ